MCETGGAGISIDFAGAVLCTIGLGGPVYALIEQGRLWFAPCESGVPNTMDLLFRSMAREVGPGAIAVILTGMGSDGREGAAWIKAKGGPVGP